MSRPRAIVAHLTLVSCVVLAAAKKKAKAPAPPEPTILDTILDALSTATGADAAALAIRLPGALLGALLAALCYWGVGRRARRRALPADFMQPVDPTPQLDKPVAGSTASGMGYTPGDDRYGSDDDSDDSDGIVADPAPPRRRPS